MDMACQRQALKAHNVGRGSREPSQKENG